MVSMTVKPKCIKVVTKKYQMEIKQVDEANGEKKNSKLHMT